MGDNHIPLFFFSSSFCSPSLLLFFLLLFLPLSSVIYIITLISSLNFFTVQWLEFAVMMFRYSQKHMRFLSLFCFAFLFFALCCIIFCCIVYLFVRLSVTPADSGLQKQRVKKLISVRRIFGIFYTDIHFSIDSPLIFLISPHFSSSIHFSSPCLSCHILNGSWTVNPSQIAFSPFSFHLYLKRQEQKFMKEQNVQE